MAQRSRSRSPSRERGQLELFSPSAHPLPSVSEDRFPNNYNNRKAGDRIEQDLRNSADQLIITGFTSLEKIVDYLASYYGAAAPPPSLRILLGHEPAAPKQSPISGKVKLPRAIADYWLERGVSILQCAAIVAAIQVLTQARERETIQVRTSDTRIIHAKIYKGDDAITTGSSNFSRSGLGWQIESNVRFTAQNDPDRWQELAEYAEWVWSEGRDYVDGLIALLEQLLSGVTWQEALARACAEVLEGDWARRYISQVEADEPIPLWPTQRQGIAQAMWIMENLGSVLVADATGSGKTRMGAHLIKAAIERMWRTGQKRVDAPILTCPRSIEAFWREEFELCRLGVEIYTHGILSRTDAKKATRMGHALRQVQVFAIDEAHNFLDHTTQRTRTLYGNLADYIILFTATPINKGVRDLVSMIDALGADNFDDDTLELLERTIWRRATGADLLSHEDRSHLRHAIERFMVRRTIGMLNQAIDREPHAYHDASGRLCRYPHQHATIYRCPEPAHDQEMSERIREEAEKLRGLVYIGQHLAPARRDESGGRSPAEELQTRLHMASRLASYYVISCVRSCRAALIEHICGTAAAQREFSLPLSLKPTETGNHIGKLERLAGQVPKNDFPVPLPEWLTDPAAHAEACREEMERYKRIADLARHLSDEREAFKAHQLAGLLHQHQKIVAFDWHLITLAVMQQRLEGLCDAEVLIATGADTAMRKRVRALFDPEVDAPDVAAIALCSDAMSEAIGLQRASAIVHLDMPSTIRKAEQRVGRLMRLNSPHPSIEVLWPLESHALTVRADEHIVERHQTVDVLIGANLELPPELSKELVVVDHLLRHADEGVRGTWDDLGDAFGPVRSLIGGDASLVPRSVYEQMRTSKARVISSVSIVQSERPWAFFAIAGTEWGAPRWVYLDDDAPELVIDLDRIAAYLRIRLTPETLPHPLDQPAMTVLERLMTRLRQDERSLLPKKKQRALHQMAVILERYLRRARDAGDLKRVQLIAELQCLAQPQVGEEAVDQRVLADCWLTLIHPVWTHRLSFSRRRRPLRIQDLTQDLLKPEHLIATDDLRAAFENAPLWVKPLDRRIVSAIVGVP